MTKDKMPNLTINKVFEECGASIGSHGKLIKSLQKIYSNTDFEEFCSEFTRLLKYSMVVYAREPVVERTIDFVVKFVCSVSSAGDDGSCENKLLNMLLGFLLESHSASSQGVRFRCCQLINKLLSNLGEDAAIDDDLGEQIFVGMLERLRDKLPLVRAQAVQALARLQNPSDKDCPVVKAYLFLIQCDPSADVRRSVLTSVAPSRRTLSAILGRTRDVKDTVRKIAYQLISEKINIKSLSIAQRIQLLNDGLNDRSDMVVKVCSNQLLQSWLKACAGNVLDLLKDLDVLTSVEICGKALTIMFKQSPLGDLVANFDLLGDKMLMDFDKLTEESAMYWCSLSRYIHSLGDTQEEYLEMVLPTCVDFCEYMRKYLEKCSQCTDPYEQVEHDFIIKQLLTMTSFMELSDQAGRKMLEKLLEDMLLDEKIHHRLVSIVMPRLLGLHSDPESLVIHLAEIISEIREPLTVVETQPGEEEKRDNDLKMAAIRVKLNELKEDMDECIHKQDFVKAAELKQKVDELEAEKADISQSLVPQVEEVRTEKTDPETWLKCLSIVCELLDHDSIKSLSPVLQTIIETLILPGVQNADPEVRSLALKSLGLCCLLKKEAALQYLVLFIQASQVDTEAVRLQAYYVLFDLLHYYGLEVLQVEPPVPSASSSDDSSTNANSTGLEASNIEALDSSSQSSTGDGESTESTRVNIASNLLSMLSAALDSDIAELRTLAAEGFAKLLMCGRVQSPKLLSHLILMWFNPLTEEDAHLRHCLGTFFPFFAVVERANQEMLEEAFMPTMKTLFNAPSSSPLAEVDAKNVADLLVQLTSAGLTRDKVQDHTIHDNLALKVCNEVLSHPDSFSVKVLVKILNCLNVSRDDVSLLKDLSMLSKQMSEAVKEKVCVKGLQKFQTGIDEMLNAVVLPGDQSSEPAVSELKPDDETKACNETNKETTDLNNVENVGEGETNDTSAKSGAVATHILQRSAKISSLAGNKTPAKTQFSNFDLDDSVFLSPTPMRKSTKKTKAVSNVSCDALDDSKQRLSSSNSRRQSNRRVLFDVDNTSLLDSN